MDEFEKVEKLRTRANVSYEEAKEALNASNGDLLDAMIYLEKQGKTATEAAYVSAPLAQNPFKSESNGSADAADKKAKRAEAAGKVKGFIKKVACVLRDNTFVVERKGNVLFTLPAWALAIIIVLLWHVSLPAIVIALFFGVRYRFEGKDDLSKVNNVMNKAGEAADSVIDTFKN